MSNRRSDRRFQIKFKFYKCHEITRGSTRAHTHTHTHTHIYIYIYVYISLFISIYIYIYINAQDVYSYN